MTTDSLYTISESVAAIFTSAGAIYAVFKHLSSKGNKKREEHKKEILHIAREEMGQISSELNNRIRDLEVELEAQKISVSKEFTYFRSAHNAEVKALGDKIESLRQDLSIQHQALLGLLTKLVDTN